MCRCVWSRNLKIQGYRNRGCQVAWVTKFYMAKPNVCGSSVWNLLRITLLVSRILRWLLYFGKFVAGLSMNAEIRTSLYENCFCSVCRKGLFKYHACKEIVSAIRRHCFALFVYNFIVKVQENQEGSELNRMSTSMWSLWIIYWPKNVLVKKYANCCMLVRRLLDITCHQNAGKKHDKKYTQ